MSAASANHKTPIYKVLYFQVICAIVIGILLGFLAPEIGAQMKPFGDGFIRLIKMIIAPVIFCTVVTGIAGMEDMKKVGKTGGLALLYFEVVSTIALIIGLIIVNTVQPGVGMHVDPNTLDQAAVSAYTGPGKDADDDGIPDERHPEYRRGRLCQRRHPAGALLLHPLRLRAAQVRRSRHADLRCDREVRTRSLPDRRHDHARGPCRRLRWPWPSRSASTASLRCCRWRS